MRTHERGLPSEVHRRASHPLRIRPAGIVRSRRAESISLQRTSHHGAAGSPQQPGDPGTALRDRTIRVRG